MGRALQAGRAIIQRLSAVGEVTARMLRLNAAERVIERRVFQTLGSYRKLQLRCLPGGAPEQWARSSFLARPQAAAEAVTKEQIRRLPLSAELKELALPP